MSRTKSVEDLALLEWLMRHEKDASDLREPYLELQQENLSFYMNYRQQPMPPGLEWVSGELLADAYLLVESILPNIGGGVFGGKSISVNAYTLAGTQVNKALDAALYRMRRQADFEYHSMDALRMAAIQGHVIQENIYVQEFGEKRYPVFSDPQFNAFGERVGMGRIIDYDIREELVYDGPRTYYPDNARVWKSAATDRLGQPLVWIKELMQDLDYMKVVNRSYEDFYGEPFYDNLDELENRHRSTLARDRQSTSNAGYNLHPRRQTATEYASDVGMWALYGSNSVVMRHAYARIPEHIRRYDDTQSRLVVYTPDGVILRDVPMPTYNMRAPFRDIFFMRVANEPYGRSPLHWALHEIEQRSEMRNLRQAEAWLNIFQTRVANRNANFDQDDNILLPGAVWMYDHDSMRPQDAIQTLPRQPVLPEIYREDAIAEDHINRVFGSTPNMQGEGLGSRATYGEAALVDARAGGRADLIARQLAYQLELGAAYDYLGIFAAFSETPLEVQVDGEEVEFPVEIFAEEIDFKYDIDINAGEYGILNGQRLQQIYQALGFFMQDPEASMHLDKRKAISAVQHRSGMDNILKSEGQVQQEQQQQMMLALQQQQAELAAQAGGGQR